MTALKLIAGYKPFSKERIGFASNTEIKRWFEAGSVEIDFVPMKWNDEIDWRPASIVLFPKGQRVTIW